MYKLTKQDINYLFNHYSTNGGHEYMIPIYKDETNSNEDEDSIESSADYFNWFDYEINFKAQEFIQTIQGYFKGNYLYGWRRMVVKNNFLDELLLDKVKRLGKYWSWLEKAAEPHGGYGYGPLDILMKAKIPKNNIDWKETIIANIDPITGEEEAEITVEEYKELFLEKITVNKKEFDISKLKSKKFLA